MRLLPYVEEISPVAPSWLGSKSRGGGDRWWESASL